MEEERKMPPYDTPVCPLMKTFCIHGNCALFDEKLKGRCLLALAAEALDLLGEMSFDRLRQKKTII